MTKTKKDIEQSITNVSGNISNAAGVVIGSNIHVEGGINVTNVTKEIESFGLNILRPEHFELYKSSKEDFDNWKKGFPLKLPNIMDKLHFQRIDLVNNIISKLDDNNEDHSILLLGKSGTSKSVTLMDIICHYFKNGYVVLYNFGDEEIKEIYELENSLRKRLKDGNKILIAVDNVHDKKTAAIFSIMDSLQSYEDKKDNIRFILTGRQPEFDRLVDDRLDTLSEPVRQSIQKLYKEIMYPIPNFDIKEIRNLLQRYKDEDEVKIFVNKNNYDYNKLFVEKDEVTLNNISSMIFEKTKGDPIVVKFLIFGKGFAADVRSRFTNYLNSETNLQTMLVCIMLERAGIPIIYDLIQQMNLEENMFHITDQTLTFLEDENKWKTIHPKWDLELLAFLYNTKVPSILVRRKKLLRNALELLLNNLPNENNKVAVLGSLFDSTTIDTEENQKFSITIIESVVNSKSNLINNNLSERSKYLLYSYYIAKNYFYSQLYEKSLSAVEEALKIYSNKKEALVSKGAILSQIGKNEEAIACYDEVITKLDPKFSTSWYNKGIALGRLGRYEEAIECQDEVITKLDPKYINAWNNKGWALGRLGRYEEAIECFDEIITKLDPKYIDAWNNKGWVLEILGRREEAIACYDEVITKLDPKSFTSWYNKGIALGRLGRYEEAIACYDEVITKLDPKYIDAWYNKGISLAGLGQYEEAIACYDEVITKLDKHVNAWYGKGYSLEILGQYEEAIQCYDTAINIDSKYIPPLTRKRMLEEKLRNRNI